MALTDAGGLSATDILALSGNNDVFGGNNGAWWIILLLLCLNGGFWGNRGFSNDASGGGTNMIPYLLSQQGTNNDVQAGFNHQALMTALSTLNTITAQGFTNVAVDSCNKTMELMQGLNTLGMQASQDKFDTISTLNNGHNAILMQMGNYEMARQQCCCDNKMAVADLKATVLSENCADRTALDNAVMNLTTAMNAGFQSLRDQNFQQQLDAARRENEQLRQQALVSNLAASQTAQTQQLYADNAAQTQRIMDYLNPPYTRPYHGFQNGQGCCNQNFNPCCGDA